MININKKIFLNSLFTFIFMYVYVKIIGNNEMYYDSWAYWTFGSNFEKNGDFNLLNYDYPLRGYILPLVSFFIKKISMIFNINNYDLFYMLSSLVFVIICNLLYPKILKNYNIKITLKKIIVFSFLFFIFWGGILLTIYLIGLLYFYL